MYNLFMCVRTVWKLNRRSRLIFRIVFPWESSSKICFWRKDKFQALLRWFAVSSNPAPVSVNPYFSSQYAV